MIAISTYMVFYNLSITHKSSIFAPYYSWQTSYPSQILHFIIAFVIFYTFPNFFHNIIFLVIFSNILKEIKESQIIFSLWTDF